MLARARTSGMAGIVCIGESLAAAARAREIASRHAGFVWHTAGIHPHDAAEFDVARDLPLLRQALAGGAVAVGECGLDYHYDHAPRDLQRRAFAQQLALALEYRKPVVVHSRDADDDTRAMVVEAGRAGIRGVLHCYTGTAALAATAIDAGWYLSFSGIVTFKKWTDDALLRLVPVDRLLAESDAPYLAPVPHRGHRNEPLWVTLTVARLAAARGATAESIGQHTCANARTFYQLD